MTDSSICSIFICRIVQDWTVIDEQCDMTYVNMHCNILAALGFYALHFNDVDKDI